MAKDIAPHHPFAPGCTLEIAAGVHGGQPVTLHVLERRDNPNGTVTAYGQRIRKTDGELGAPLGVTLSNGNQYEVTDQPYDDMAAGLTPDGRSYAIARMGTAVKVWGHLREPKVFSYDGDGSAAAAFADFHARLRDGVTAAPRPQPPAPTVVAINDAAVRVVAEAMAAFVEVAADWPADAHYEVDQDLLDLARAALEDAAKARPPWHGIERPHLEPVPLPTIPLMPDLHESTPRVMTADEVAEHRREYIAESERQGEPWSDADFVTYMRHAYGVEL